MTTEPVSSRRFRLADLMIMIAGLAFGLMGTRACADPTFQGLSRGFRWLFLIDPLLLAATLTLLVLRLCPPRPAFSRLRCQPGFITCVVAAVFSLIQLIQMLLANLIQNLTNSTQTMTSISVGEFFLLLDTDRMVSAAWLVLWWTGLWSAESDWMDRLGRGLGGLWIAQYLLHRFTLLL